MKLRTYINYGGNCEEAFKAYEKILGGKIIAMMKARGTPMEKNVAPELLDKIMHARMTVGAMLEEPLRLHKLARGPAVKRRVEQLQRSLVCVGQENRGIEDDFQAMIKVVADAHAFVGDVAQIVNVVAIVEPGHGSFPLTCGMMKAGG